MENPSKTEQGPIYIYPMTFKTSKRGCEYPTRWKPELTGDNFPCLCTTRNFSCLFSFDSYMLKRRNIENLSEMQIWKQRISAWVSSEMITKKRRYLAPLLPIEILSHLKHTLMLMIQLGIVSLRVSAKSIQLQLSVTTVLLRVYM